MRIEITIPTYNEGKIIEKNIDKLFNFLDNSKLDYNVTIANNASKDNTLIIAKKLARKYKKLIVYHTDKPGRGNALKEVWKKSKADILCYMDADLSTDLPHLNSMVELFPKYDIVLGNRLSKYSRTNRRIYRTLLSKGYNKIAKYILRIKTNDLQCGFKGIKKKVFMDIVNYTSDDNWFFDSQLIVWGEKKGYKIAEIPIKWIERKASKVKIRSTVTNYLKNLWKLRKELGKNKVI